VRWLSDEVLAHLRKVTAAPDLTGTRYDLVEQIGQGGMGTVYLARDRELDRPVALKVLDVLPEGTQVEARVLARLEHPGIVPVHDAGVLPDGRFFYVMKLVRGKRLDEPGALPEGQVERLQIFLKLCDAVAFAHAHGILHRDLKPQNVMLGPFGEVLVMDWGAAQAIGGSAAATVVGTPGYMAPEQARGEPDLDARADVYALGAVLHFLLTGQAPGESGPRVKPKPLEAVCKKALAADRSGRYATAAELGADVARSVAGRRVTAYPENVWELSRRLAVKYRTVLALILAYLVMRIVLLAVLGL
jgi:serine/threonine protein kinase